MGAVDGVSLTSCLVLNCGSHGGEDQKTEVGECEGGKRVSEWFTGC